MLVEKTKVSVPLPLALSIYTGLRETRLEPCYLLITNQ